jgi:CSLREA domain-containing protein
MDLSIRPLRSLLLAAALAAPFGAAAAGAATIIVDTDLDADSADGVCSLREAILAANSDAAHNDCAAGSGPDRIVFALTTPAEIILTADLPVITETLLIRGPGPLQLTLSGADLHRLLHFDTADGGWLGVERLTLYDGRSPGGAGGHGGGAYVGGGEEALFHRVTFLENRSADAGGGLAVVSTGSPPTSVTVLECLFSGNESEGPSGGGGVALIATGGEVRVVRSTLLDNLVMHESGSGGGIVARRGTLVLEASTVGNNRAKRSGGGVALQVTGPTPSLGSLIVRDSTITGNLADSNGDLDGEGGGLHLSAEPPHTSTLALENSVVAGNFDNGPLEPSDLSCAADLQLVASSASFIGSNQGCDTLFPTGSPNADGNYVGTPAAPLDPLLLPLADNGGPTPTHRPLFSPPFVISPLIDRGSCPDVGADQRGFGDLAAGLRRVDLVDVPTPPGGDGCDIGAVEVGAAAGIDPVLFADGFEAGHTLLWSTEVL